MLADVNQPRPKSIDYPLVKPLAASGINKKTWAPRTEQRYVFRRAE
jgi:hypothetical protein